MRRPCRIGLATLAALAGALSVTLVTGINRSAAAGDFGLEQANLLHAQSMQLFGVNHPLAQSSTASILAAEAQADPTRLVSLAGSLTARLTSRVAAPNVDIMALWPDDTNPTHLIACNEQGANAPGLQRIDIATGDVATILTGTSSCDPVRRTPWGTIVFAEEAGGGPSGGRVYELINPLDTTGVTLNRSTGVFSGGTGAGNFAVRSALGRLSYEGLAIYANGLVYYGDESRPSNGTPGGAYFKFVPASLRNPDAGPITSLSDSPLANGSIFGLRAGFTDYGQGTQYGFGRWAPIPAAPEPDLRAQAAALKLTGYYRPEDIDIDRVAEAQGRVRFCGNNTGNEEEQNYGETICISDGTLSEAGANPATLTPEAQLLVAGNPAFNVPDNIAYQPGRANWVVHEDGDTGYLRPHNDDLWDCLPDGADADLLSDGCIRIGTLNDLDAEWTGGIFDATGKRFFVSVQHNVTGQGLVLEITGWK